jgi:hypothetical protein
VGLEPLRNGPSTGVCPITGQCTSRSAIGARAARPAGREADIQRAGVSQATATMQRQVVCRPPLHKDSSGRVPTVRDLSRTRSGQFQPFRWLKSAAHACTAEARRALRGPLVPTSGGAAGKALKCLWIMVQCTDYLTISMCHGFATAPSPPMSTLREIWPRTQLARLKSG